MKNIQICPICGKPFEQQDYNVLTYNGKIICSAKCLTNKDKYLKQKFSAVVKNNVVKEVEKPQSNDIIDVTEEQIQEDTQPEPEVVVETKPKPRRTSKKSTKSSSRN